jgi:hypothetical protein
MARADEGGGNGLAAEQGCGEAQADLGHVNERGRPGDSDLPCFLEGLREVVTNLSSPDDLVASAALAGLRAFWRGGEGAGGLPPDNTLTKLLVVMRDAHVSDVAELLFWLNSHPDAAAALDIPAEVLELLSTFNHHLSDVYTHEVFMRWLTSADLPDVCSGSDAMPIVLYTLELCRVADLLPANFEDALDVQPQLARLLPELAARLFCVQQQVRALYV